MTAWGRDLRDRMFVLDAALHDMFREHQQDRVDVFRACERGEETTEQEHRCMHWIDMLVMSRVMSEEYIQ